MRLLCDENIVGLESIAPLCELRVAPGRQIRRADLADIDALWVRSVTRVDAALLEGTPVRFVGTATAGTEHVDSAYLGQCGIEFHSTPGANANAVVEYVLAVLAELREPWELLDAGGTLGIVGFGHVGRALHAVAAALGWQVRVCDPWVARGEPAGATPARVELEPVLGADVISLHCELTDTTPWPSRHLLDQGRLAALGSSQWLINAARGEVVDGAALLARLRECDPPQLALDVWEREPEFDPALLRSPALRIATPHIAGYSWDAKWAATQALAAATFHEAAESLRAPLEAPAPLEIGAGGGALFARDLLRQRYDVRTDDAALRDIATIGRSPERGIAFDALRARYRIRRELRGSALAAGARADGQQRRVLEALGVDAHPVPLSGR